ncbi:hypothetical protein QTN47_22560 [Danxiaibacter flavus]|uniref:Peptidase S74 domain-containing protein n=1 Tax=Danxiaibacter flavus TaxID=3049108 RepID=A0ABV3ZLB6_9BACT|nr:hypothetical protein QNM32_22565 [Chitinophagaceae bacterium DXS]
MNRILIILMLAGTIQSNAQNVFPSNGNVGIGTSTPEVKLDVRGAINAYSESHFSSTIYQDPDVGVAYAIKIGSGGIAANGNAVFMNGSVGIGCKSPASDLHIQKNAVGGTVATIENTYDSYAHLELKSNNKTWQWSKRPSYEGDGLNLWYRNNNDPWRQHLTITTSGNFGIGTVDPKDYKLAVNGPAIFTKAVIKNYSNWPDYVFDSNYQLPSLESISIFIKENKHLPEVPSALAIERDGHDLGEVQKLLLKKVEELTLYVIELKKENENIKNESQKQRKQIEQMRHQNSIIKNYVKQ